MVDTEQAEQLFHLTAPTSPADTAGVSARRFQLEIAELLVRRSTRPHMRIWLWREQRMLQERLSLISFALSPQNGHGSNSEFVIYFLLAFQSSSPSQITTKIRAARARRLIGSSTAFAKAPSW